MPSVWDSIIIHHSETDDDAFAQDWEGIRRFHMSNRFNGDTITEEKAKDMISRGISGVTPPWHDIGYHWGIERVKGLIVFQKGRPMTETGAHCIGMNNRAIGICCVGNFDERKPDDMIYYNAAQLISGIMKQFPAITISRIYPHSKFAPKTCPGKQFDMDRLIRYVRCQIGGGIQNDRG
jgi:N-acetylmuramoyl-L-alanine amidase